MFNPIKIFTHRQTAEPVVSEPKTVFVREDFVIADYEEKTITELLAALRERTYDFVYDNRLVCGTTEFMYYDLPIAVKLTEDWNIVYQVNAYTTKSVNDAVSVIADAIQF